MDKREPGFYWVKERSYFEEWDVAILQLDPADQPQWHILGAREPTEKEPEVIGPRIEPPEEGEELL